VTQDTFHPGFTFLEVTGSTRLELEEDLFLRWNITSLTFLVLKENNITKIWQQAFYSLADLETLDLDVNRITKLDSQTFYYNTRLQRLYLSRNSSTAIHPLIFQENLILSYLRLGFNNIISLHPDLFKNNLELLAVGVEGNGLTDIHPSTFRNNRKLYEVNLSGNRIISIDPETFSQNWSLFNLFLSNNRITDVYPSTFRNRSSLINLDISRNKITSLNPDTFIHNKHLRDLYLQGNNITEISKSSFHGLENLQVLDLSNNNIGDLNPLVFQNILTNTDRQNHQPSKLKYLNLAQNMLRSFNFELYFPMNSNSDTPNPTFQLQYLNLSSNRLTTLDVASMKWLNETTAYIDLTQNLWNCDCSVLLEVWRGLKHKLTLHCASPRELQGKSWDMIEEFCYQASEDMNKESNSSSEAVRPTTILNDESELSTQNGVPSVVKITLIVIGVVFVCAIVGCFILAKVAKRLRKRQKTPEYCDVYPARASRISIHSYEEISLGTSQITDLFYADVGVRPSYITVQS